MSLSEGWLSFVKLVSDLLGNHKAAALDSTPQLEGGSSILRR